MTASSSHAIAEVEPGLYERTLTMNGVSKAYAMTGWRIGYAGGPEALIKAMAKLQSQTTSNADLDLAMGGGRGAERAAGFHHRAAQQAFKERRDLVVSHAQPGERHRMPDAGRRVLRLSVLRRLHRQDQRRRASASTTDEDFVTALLEEEGVAVVQGAAFGLSPFFRISYATSNAALEEACRRIQRFCAELR